MEPSTERDLVLRGAAALRGPRQSPARPNGLRRAGDAHSDDEFFKPEEFEREPVVLRECVICGALTPKWWCSKRCKLMDEPEDAA